MKKSFISIIIFVLSLSTLLLITSTALATPMFPTMAASLETEPSPATATAAAADNAPAAPDAVSSTTLPPTGKLYGIGSVSKIFTAAAVMKLAGENKLNIDEPLINYIPDFIMADARYTLITPRMLLNHSSGLMGMTNNNAFLIGDNDTYLHDHILELLCTQTLKHDPGDRSIYCNDGFTLAEILIERASGMTYTDFIAKYFTEPLALDNVKTPQSAFDREKLAYTYLGAAELKPERLGMLGSGGVYATMEDLCRFATIFMDGSDGSILSKTSVGEMTKPQHQMEMAPPDSDTVFRYGLGWDCVEQYPFNRYGIKALSKGGATTGYFTHLTVLPEYNLAAAVATSGTGGLEALIAQEIILAVLEEEGLIPGDSTIVPPDQNMDRAQTPDYIKSRAGVYAAGMWGQYDVAVTDDSLILTPIGELNERPMIFNYNTDGKFVSTNGDFMGINTSVPGAVGATTLSFDGDYIMLQTYENVPGLSATAETLPLAERIAPNPVSGDAWDAWTMRNGKEYLLVSEKYTSRLYINNPVAKTQVDERVFGYVLRGIYEAGGTAIPAARIVDGYVATGFQNTPTMTGRDIVNLNAIMKDSVEYLQINSFLYIDATAAVPFSALGETITIAGEPIWVDIGGGLGGKIINITTPENGSWFIYDDKMNCVATSLEKNPRATIVLPVNGRLIFAGEPGAVFTLR